MPFTPKNCQSETALYFIRVYIINRTLHGCLEIRNFSSCVEKIFSTLEEKFLISSWPCNIPYVCDTQIKCAYCRVKLGLGLTSIQPGLIQNILCFLALINISIQRKFWFNLKTDFTYNIHLYLDQTTSSASFPNWAF